MSTGARQEQLDVLVLRTLASGPQHGLGLARRLLQRSDGILDLNQGTLYTELLRLEQRRWITSRWGLDDHKRQAKFFQLTLRGWRRLYGRHGFTVNTAQDERTTTGAVFQATDGKRFVIATADTRSAAENL